MNTATRLKILRLLSGLTHDALAEITGVNRSLFSNWESGKYGPASKTVGVIAQALSTYPGHILYGDPPPQEVIWEPAPPRARNGNYTKQYLSDFEQLLPQYWQENKFTEFAQATFPDGGLLLFAGRGKTFDYALLIPPVLADIVRHSMTPLYANVVGEVDGDFANIPRKHLASEIARLSPRKISVEYVTLLLSKKRGQQAANPADQQEPIVKHGLTVDLTAENEHQPTLVIQGEFGTARYAVNKVTGEIRRVI